MGLVLQLVMGLISQELNVVGAIVIIHAWIQNGYIGIVVARHSASILFSSRLLLIICVYILVIPIICIIMILMDIVMNFVDILMRLLRKIITRCVKLHGDF